MNSPVKQLEGSQFLQWFGPLLDAVRALGGSGTPDEVTDEIATSLGIPDEQLNESVLSGQQTRFKNQVAWARDFFAVTRPEMPEQEAERAHRRTVVISQPPAGSQFLIFRRSRSRAEK